MPLNPEAPPAAAACLLVHSEMTGSSPRLQGCCSSGWNGAVTVLVWDLGDSEPLALSRLVCQLVVQREHATLGSCELSGLLK